MKGNRSITEKSTSVYFSKLAAFIWQMRIDFCQSLEKRDFPLINLSSMCLAIETVRFQSEQTEVPIPYAVHIIEELYRMERYLNEALKEVASFKKTVER